MKKEWHTTLGAAVFLGLMLIAYWIWSVVDRLSEPSGTVMLLFGGSAYLLLACYILLQWIRRHRIERPEDNVNATQADGAGEVGFFPAASIWPASIGLGAIFFGIALIYGTWYWVIGAILLFGAIIGFVVESEARQE